jgi:hypothetical protein
VSDHYGVSADGTADPARNDARGAEMAKRSKTARAADEAAFEALANARLRADDAGVDAAADEFDDLTGGGASRPAKSGRRKEMGHARGRRRARAALDDDDERGGGGRDSSAASESSKSRASSSRSSTPARPAGGRLRQRAAALALMEEGEDDEFAAGAGEGRGGAGGGATSAADADEADGVPAWGGEERVKAAAAAVAATLADGFAALQWLAVIFRRGSAARRKNGSVRIVIFATNDDHVQWLDDVAVVQLLGAAGAERDSNGVWTVKAALSGDMLQAGAELLEGADGP